MKTADGVGRVWNRFVRPNRDLMRNGEMVSGIRKAVAEYHQLAVATLCGGSDRGKDDKADQQGEQQTWGREPGRVPSHIVILLFVDKLERAPRYHTAGSENHRLSTTLRLGP